MATRLSSGRAGALAVIGGALCTLVAAAPAQGVCVGDCNNMCEVTISNLIVGVNIALGNQPASNCPAFQNEQGEVNIVQLIRGVNNAQNGCNPADCEMNPTDTPTEVIVDTPTATPTSGDPTPTPTETATTVPSTPGLCTLEAGTCVGGTNNGADCTAAVQCPQGRCDFKRLCVGGANAGASCTSDANCRVCVGGANAGMQCAVDGDCPGGSCPAGGTCPTLGDVSKIELNVAALPLPLSFALLGELQLNRGEIVNNEGEMQCIINNIAPINIPAIGFVCITPPDEPCPGTQGTIDCDGGSILGIELLSDGNIGECLSNDACSNSCDTYCDDIGGIQQTSGCIGYCSGSTPQQCMTDADCLATSNGACNGPDPAGSNADICQCQCVNTAAGGDSRPGDFQCQLGSSLVVESGAPCNGTDVSIEVGTACIPVTTSTAGSKITNANFNPPGCPGGGPPCMLPATGAILNTGVPVACSEYDEGGSVSGLQGVGVVNFFGSALGDIAVELFAVCK